MRDLWKFYQWGMSYKQENDIIGLGFFVATMIVYMGYVGIGFAFMISGYPFITGIMVIVPFALGGRIAVRRYKKAGKEENSR